MSFTRLINTTKTRTAVVVVAVTVVVAVVDAVLLLLCNNVLNYAARAVAVAVHTFFCSTLSLVYFLTSLLHHFLKHHFMFRSSARHIYPT